LTFSGFFRSSGFVEIFWFCSDFLVLFRFSGSDSQLRVYESRVLMRVFVIRRDEVGHAVSQLVEALRYK
jgi:hypothetical protein